jgi:hypothetical protein
MRTPALAALVILTTLASAPAARADYSGGLPPHDVPVRVRSMSSGHCLAVQGGNGAAIVQEPCDPARAGQRFTFTEVLGLPMIRTVHGKCWNVHAASRADGAWITQWDCLAQLNEWFAPTVGARSGFRIESTTRGPRPCLLTRRDGPLVQYGCDATGDQRFQWEPA